MPEFSKETTNALLNFYLMQMIESPSLGMRAIGDFIPSLCDPEAIRQFTAILAPFVSEEAKSQIRGKISTAKPDIEKIIAKIEDEKATLEILPEKGIVAFFNAAAAALPAPVREFFTQAYGLTGKDAATVIPAAFEQHRTTSVNDLVLKEIEIRRNYPKQEMTEFALDLAERWSDPAKVEKFVSELMSNAPNLMYEASGDELEEALTKYMAGESDAVPATMNFEKTGQLLQTWYEAIAKADLFPATAHLAPILREANILGIPALAASL